MKITRFLAGRVELPLHEPPYECSGGKSVTVFDTSLSCSEELEAIDKKRAKVRQMRHCPDSYLKKCGADLISPAEVAMRKRGASNAGYKYFGCAKTFALMGKAFAEATLMNGRQPQRRTTISIR